MREARIRNARTFTARDAAIKFLENTNDEDFSTARIEHFEARVCKNCGEDVSRTPYKFTNGETTTPCLVCGEECCTNCGTDGYGDVVHVNYKGDKRKCMGIFRRIREAVK